MYETKKIREIAERKSDEIARIQHSILIWQSMDTRFKKCVLSGSTSGKRRFPGRTWDWRY